MIAKKIFQYWIGIFGHSNKILVNNGGEGGRGINVRVCSTAAESPWCNGLIERHNDILSLTVTKTMEDIKSEL